VHFVTVARWRAQHWKARPSRHPLEIARSQLEAVAPIVSGDPETTLEDVVEPHKRDFDELADSEVLRRAAREVAIATTLVAKEIQNRTTASLSAAEVVPALLSIGACLAALPNAFDQVASLDAADRRNDNPEQKA